MDRHLIATRVPVSEAVDFQEWRFLAHTRWQQNFHHVTPIVRELASENFVSWILSSRKFVLMYNHRAVSDEIHLRTAPELGGPWSEPVVVYECPEISWDLRNFCYGAKAHPSLFSEDDLVLTYFSNSTDFWYVAGNAQLYWPKFVRVLWSALR